MVWRTTIITVTTCFLLGTTFTHWIADHNVLWRSPLTPEALSSSIQYYALLGSGPQLLAWFYLGVGVVALAVNASKLVSAWGGKGGEVLFDGASLLLVASITYNQATEVYPTLLSFPSPLPADLTEHAIFPALGAAVRDLANDNIITAVMLTGVMLLQGGRYYASRSSESTSFPRSADVSAASTPSPSSEQPNPFKRVSERHATPYRELTEAEALEIELEQSASDAAAASSPARRKPRKARAGRR